MKLIKLNDDKYKFEVDKQIKISGELNFVKSVMLRDFKIDPDELEDAILDMEKTKSNCAYFATYTWRESGLLGFIFSRDEPEYNASN